jgi:two-component system sensor histidine kinase MprB
MSLLRVHRRWHYRRSLASRVTLLTTIAVALAIASMALGSFGVMKLQLQRSLDQSLLDRASKAATYPTLSEMSRNEVPSWMVGAADVRIIFLQIVGGRVDVTTADDGARLTLGEAELEVATGATRSSVRTITAEGGVRYRIAAVPAGEDQALILAQPVTGQESTLRRLGTVMLLFGAAGVIAAALAGWLVAANGLRPVRRLTAAAEHVARTEDLTPLRVEGGDEVARLSMAFNQMLVALSASRDRQRRLVADAGHELRTPLTSLRTNLELLTQADRDAADGAGGLPRLARTELLDDVRFQVEELSTLVGDLVELARDEPPVEVIEDVDLVEVVHRGLERVRRRAPGLRFDVELAPWHLEGDATALERATTNLLDNAAKWSPSGGTIVVRLAGGTLTVDDEGPGIAPEDREHVFERFWRSTESRTLPGSGLGLSIVRQVVDRHAGSIAIGESPAGGSRLTMVLPGSDA